jgi:hypothetical protein
MYFTRYNPLYPPPLPPPRLPPSLSLSPSPSPSPSLSGEQPVLVLPLHHILCIHARSAAPPDSSAAPPPPLEDGEGGEDAGLEEGDLALYTRPESRFHGRRLVLRAPSARLRDDWAAAIGSLAQRARECGCGEERSGGIGRVAWYRTRARSLYYSDDVQTLLAVVVCDPLHHLRTHPP